MKPLVFSLLALVITACSPHTPATPVAVETEPEQPPVKVTTRPAEQKPMPRYLRVTGQLKGSQDAVVAANAAGKVIVASVERGSVVKAGDVLIKLDSKAAELAVKEAEASVASAQIKLTWSNDELKRNEPLATSKAISDTDFQRLKNDKASAEAGLAAAMARRDTAQKTVDDATIRAPFAGTVAERLTDLGEYVRADSPVVHLVAIDTLHLWLNVPETSVGQLKEGQAVSFTVPAFTGETFSGTVKFIGASVRESARDLIIEAVVPNANAKLKPGMFAEGLLTLGEAAVVTVPTSALRSEGSSKKVFVVRDQRIEEHLVEVGETKGDSVEIRRGVQKDDPVVIEPSAAVVDGAKVAAAAQP